MDGEVRVIDAGMALTGGGSSHTAHSIRPSSTGLRALADAPESRRDMLIAATVEVVSEGSVDRLPRTQDTSKALCF